MSELMSGNLSGFALNSNDGGRYRWAGLLPLLFCFGIGTPGVEAQDARMVPVIPAPASVEGLVGALSITPALRVGEVAEAFRPVVERETAKLSEALGFELGQADSDGPRIVVRADLSLPPEAYVLEVSEASLAIDASTEAGVFYAFQTLRQLVPAGLYEAGPAGSRPGAIPAVRIEDRPRFPYRGLHLDVGRHFFSVDFVKRYIDTMARFKLNRFHWHLTEDQGWRIQIDGYPRLTEVGAWRAESPIEKRLNPYVGDGVRHGGFYTKDEIRDIVAFAAERFVTVIPEIEMPGHATAALASYPWLGCTEEVLAVSTTWGVHDTIFCPHEETFDFLTSVLDEVMALFPSEYIHIGGDEVPKRQWRESAAAQAVIRREGLAGEDELQSWFIRRIERHLRANGRRLIGWDEILEGGLAPDATVMSWRGVEGGIEAARQGHDVVMTPIQHSYFDFYQGDPSTEPLAMNWAGFPIPLRRVYEFEPVPPDLTEDQAPYVIGGQANLWTEYIATPEYAEYMVYPRALALSEVVWSPAESRDWSGFVARMERALALLDALGVRYRPPHELDGR